MVVRSRPYRLPEHKKKVVQSELEAMLEMGVIEESRSDWASPIVLVPKTDGSVRFCVDYRKVNAVSKFDAYPMPRVDELLDRLGTARFYSTLDLTKGYWQIPLSPLSKEKSAFTTPFGLHQFVTLPFGLFGAPATFQLNLSFHFTYLKLQEAQRKTKATAVGWVHWHHCLSGLLIPCWLILFQ